MEDWRPGKAREAAMSTPLSTRSLLTIYLVLTQPPYSPVVFLQCCRVGDDSSIWRFQQIGRKVGNEKHFESRHWVEEMS
jgi:hypothetical protein